MPAKARTARDANPMLRRFEGGEDITEWYDVA